MCVRNRKLTQTYLTISRDNERRLQLVEDNGDLNPRHIQDPGQDPRKRQSNQLSYSAIRRTRQTLIKAEANRTRREILLEIPSRADP